MKNRVRELRSKQDKPENTSNDNIPGTEAPASVWKPPRETPPVLRNTKEGAVIDSNSNANDNDTVDEAIFERKFMEMRLMLARRKREMGELFYEAAVMQRQEFEFNQPTVTNDDLKREVIAADERVIRNDTHRYYALYYELRDRGLLAKL